MFLFSLGCWWWCGWRRWFGVCGGGGGSCHTGALSGLVWACRSGLGVCVWVWFCGVRQPCVWLRFLTLEAAGWYRRLLAVCAGSVKVACCSHVWLAAVSFAVGFPFSGSGGDWWCRLRALSACWRCWVVSRLSWRGVWCRFCWVGVLVVGVRQLVSAHVGCVQVS